jgi:hypothetical protein
MIGRARWLDSIEGKAYRRLRELRERGLWDGRPPVPVDHVLEHLLDLSISWETVLEKDDEEILACLRPETRQVVLNERYRNRFESVPGLERFCKGHEAGHADVYALCAVADQIQLLPHYQYRPTKRSTPHGDVAVLTSRLRGLPRSVRTDVLQKLKGEERERRAAGEDTPLERRAVEHYAAVLLMPEEAVKASAAAVDLSRWPNVYALASEFDVSRVAMRIRLEELGLIHGVGPDGRILMTNPALAGQTDLFS